jgi:hypothetical protein
LSFAIRPARRRRKTESMYNRYNVVPERDLADVMQKRERFLSDTPARNPNAEKA